MMRALLGRPTTDSRAAARVMLCCAWLVACAGDRVPEPAKNPLCGFSCAKLGLAEGNAAISGVPSADAYFAAAVGYRTAAEQQSAALEAELADIRASFGIAKTAALGAELKRLGSSLLASGPTVVASQALCWVDSQRLLALASQCDPDLAAGMTILCRGPCRVDASTMCGRLAKLECTTTAKSEDCGTDLCSGTCTDAPDQSGGCDGACLGDCNGTCERFAADAKGALRCAGSCAGKCSGTCKHAIDRAVCRGTCEGTCTRTDPADGCDSAIETRCQPNAGRDFDCPGACGGVFDAKLGKAECGAAAAAQARYLAQCDTPWVRVHYALSGTSPTAEQQRYVNALRALQERLPAVIAQRARAKLIANAGETLATAASGAVKDSLRARQKAADLDNQTRAGLPCALAELGRVSKALSPSGQRLSAAVGAADELLTALGIN
jgi:hypothetical protein